MAVSGSDLKFYSTTNGLGGAKQAGEQGAIFPDVSPAEAAAGVIHYACIYIENTNGTDTLVDAELIKTVVTPSDDTIVEIGLDPAGLDGTATTIANANTAPAGVTFADFESAVSLGDLAAGEFYPFWLRRTVSVDAASIASDGFTMQVQGATA